MLLIGLAVWMGLWWWVGFLTAFTLLLGVFELLAWKYTGKTLSAMFGELRAKNQLKADVFLLAFIVAALALVLHLIAMTSK